MATAQELIDILQDARDSIDTAIEMMKNDESTDEYDLEYIGEMYHAAVEALADLDTYARQF